MPKFEKGSQEAKDYMASIRAKRGGSPTKTPSGVKGGRIARSPIPPPPPPPPRRPPTPPSPPPIRRVPTLNLAVVNDDRVRRINEITEWLLAGRNASMPIGQFYSQQQMETLRAEREELERQLQQEREATQGQGIVSDAVDALKTGATKVGQYAKAVVFGRGEAYPPKVRTLLEKYGTSKITSAELRRSPVQSLLTSAMNALTFGKFKKNMAQTPYDQLFHLQIVLTLENGTKLLLEKNEVINMDVLTSQSLPKGTEVLPITPFTSVVLNDALEKTKASMGSKAFFDYNAENNNCQDFISVFLRSNGMGDANDFTFVKQDTKKLFKGLSGLAKTAYTLTELGERANVLLTGAGMTSSKVADAPSQDLKERLDKKMAVAKATQASLYRKAMKAEKEAKKAISGKGAAASISPQGQLSRKYVERENLLAEMSLLQRRMDSVMMSSGSMSEKFGRLSQLGNEMDRLLQRLESLNAEINVIENILFPNEAGNDDSGDSGGTESMSSVEGEGIGSNYIVQSVIFKKDIFSVSKAKKWLKEHKYKVVKVDRTSGMLRFRQIEPMEVEKMGFTEYRTKSLGDSGVELVLVYKPMKKQKN